MVDKYAPRFANVFTLSAVIAPSFVAPISRSVMWSRPCVVETKFSERSSTNLTGRPSLFDSQSTIGMS